jgi:hypothetical protein
VSTQLALAKLGAVLRKKAS